MFSVLVIRLRSLRLLRVSGIVMRLRMFLLLITFLKASHSRSEERFSRNAETDLVCRLLLEKKKTYHMSGPNHAAAYMASLLLALVRKTIEPSVHGMASRTT